MFVYINATLRFWIWILFDGQRLHTRFLKPQGKQDVSAMNEKTDLL